MKKPQGRKSPIVSDQNLQRVSSRVSVEAVAILAMQPNKAAFLDEAIKEKFKKK